MKLIISAAGIVSAAILAYCLLIHVWTGINRRMVNWIALPMCFIAGLLFPVSYRRNAGKSILFLVLGAYVFAVIIFKYTHQDCQGRHLGQKERQGK